LEWCVIVDCLDARDSTLNEQKGDDLGIVHVDGPVQGVPATIAHLIEQVASFTVDDLYQLLLIIDVVRLLLHDGSYFG
jgi:hypothetical protein